MATERYLNTDEVAQIFQVKRGTVNRWVREKKLPNFRTPSGRARFRPQDIKRLLEVDDAEEAS
jgi:excisionase family DNA binding protein